MQSVEPPQRDTRSTAIATLPEREGFKFLYANRTTVFTGAT